MGESLGFVFAQTEDIDEAWQALATSRLTHDSAPDHQWGGWYWSDGKSNFSNTADYIARAKALGCSTLMLAGIVDWRTWEINKTAIDIGRVHVAGLAVTSWGTNKAVMLD